MFTIKFFVFVCLLQIFCVTVTVLSHLLVGTAIGYLVWFLLKRAWQHRAHASRYLTKTRFDQNITEPPYTGAEQ